MSSASMTFGRPARLVIPRGAQWFANLAHFLIQAAQRADQWLVASARPEPKTPQEVLEWARRIERTEPGFAADLEAAALRAIDRDARR